MDPEKPTVQGAGSCCTRWVCALTYSVSAFLKIPSLSLKVTALQLLDPSNYYCKPYSVVVTTE